MPSWRSEKPSYVFIVEVWCKSLVCVNLVLTLVIWRRLEEAIVTRMESKQQQFLALCCGTTGSRAAASVPGAVADIWIAGVRPAVGLAATALFG